MDENLVGYLLNGLDEASHRQVEAYVTANAEGRRKLELLRRGLEPLAADRKDFPPPPGLAMRTMTRLAEQGSGDLPHAPSPAGAFAGDRPLWRRADFLVAASVLIGLFGLLAPALLRLRDRAPIVACQENLHQFFAALKTYHDQHGQFPDVNAQAPHNVAGMVVPLLIHAGVLSSEASVRCPGNGSPPSPLPLEKIKALTPAEFKEQAPFLASCYAYSLGFRDEEGLYHGPVFLPGKTAKFPLMSDRPPADLGNSPNHGGAGQNVLFQDGHVSFLPVRSVDFDEDIFRNRAGKEAPGIGSDDVVLGSSAASTDP